MQPLPLTIYIPDGWPEIPGQPDITPGYGAAISVNGTSYPLARGTKSGVNYLGYKNGNNVIQLTMQQLQELARDAAGRALNQNDTTTMKNGFSAYTNLVDNIRRLLATTRGNNDGHNAVYAINVDLKQAVAKNGYALDKADGTLELVKRSASISGIGSLTYGDTDGTIKTWDGQVQGLADGSQITYNTSIKDGSAYTRDRGSRNTANHGTYADSVDFNDITITDAEGHVISADANYDLSTTGTIQVNKAKLIIDTAGNTREYGQAAEVTSDIAGAASIRHADTAVVNGDTAADILAEMGLYTTSDALVTTAGGQRTNHVGSYDLTAHFTDTSNYEVSAGVTGKEILTPKTIYAEVTGSGSDFDHIAWQVVRNPESQLVNGDQGVFQYGLGPVISRKDQLFGVDITMNGRYPP